MIVYEYHYTHYPMEFHCQCQESVLDSCIMQAASFATADEFLDCIQPFLEAQETINNLILGISLRMVSSPEWAEFPVYFGAVEKENREIILAAVMTPPYEIVLTNSPPMATEPELQSAVDALIDNLKDNRWQPPGVNGPKQISRRFALSWSERNHLPMRVKMEERVYELRKVITPRWSPGFMRLAAPDDLEILTQWQTSFLKEALGEYKPEMARRNSARRIATEEAFIWDDHGPVSMAIKTRPTPHGCTVSGVYTPPELRGRGYATSCVAALSQRLLDSGKQFCNLFTDLANPTSNSIYQKIGYEPVCDFSVYRFDEAGE